jgi:ABC-type multidrug transport system fused ATPase/permease subunit
VKGEGRVRLKRFWVYLRPFSHSIVLLFLSILLSLLITLPTPWLEKTIIDQAIVQGDTDLLLRVVGLIIGLFAGYRVLIFFRSILSVRVKQKVLTSVRMAMYDHLQRMSLRFFARHPVGNLISRITNDVTYVQSLMNDELFEVIGSAIKLLLIVGLLFALSPTLTLMCAGILPVVALVFFLFKRRVYIQNRRLQEAQETLSGRIQQNFTCMKMIQAEVIEDQMRRETLEASQTLEQVGIRRETLGVTANLFSTLSSYIPVLTIIWAVGGTMVIRGTMTLGELLAFTQYLMGLINPVQQFFKFNMDLQAGYAALDRIYEVLDEAPDIADTPEAEPLEPPIRKVTFEDVSLSFGLGEGEELTTVTALDGVSFEIAQGEKVALVGTSGSGKSSTAHLLLRFFDPTSGRVLINDRPMSDYSLVSLRQAMAYVPQEVFLLGASVRRNLALDRPVDDGRLEASLEGARAREFVRDLETAVEPGGTNFSGGQRQRLILARALAKDVGFYVLDEATSALDPATEVEVMRNLARFLEGKTAVLIAHRLTFLDLVDRILVFANGRLVEEGSFQELMDQRGMFYGLYQAQG